VAHVTGETVRIEEVAVEGTTQAVVCHGPEDLEEPPVPG
jgi:hypothetical protein